jgi:hypothetical protein
VLLERGLQELDELGHAMAREAEASERVDRDVLGIVNRRGGDRKLLRRPDRRGPDDLAREREPTRVSSRTRWPLLRGRRRASRPAQARPVGGGSCRLRERGRRPEERIAMTAAVMAACMARRWLAAARDGNSSVS